MTAASKHPPADCAGRHEGAAWGIAVAFAVVYLVWGSTYLAIRIGVSSIPPLLLAGLRFFCAGALVLVYSALRREAAPHSRRDWVIILATALLMPAAGNGLVTWAEQWVASNQTALIVATSALWTACFGAVGTRGEPLRPAAMLGLLIGFAGVAVLIGDGWYSRAAPWTAYGALVLSPMLWSLGTVLSRRSPVRCSLAYLTGWQMLIAGGVLGVLSALHGEWTRFAGSPRAFAALAYLVVFGSCIAYAAYFWLVRHVPPVQVGTTAYVNPAVAAVLGWLLLDERMTKNQWIGTAIILAGTMLVSLTARSGRVAQAQPDEP
jgi:drug/metabolite transporter (DMT)-like permease